MSPPYDYQTPEETDQVSQWAHWIAPHWGYFISTVFFIGGLIWRAASLVNEIRALRKDHERLAASISRFMAEERLKDDGWKSYVDGKFEKQNQTMQDVIWRVARMPAIKDRD